jgi:hypothetical protein
LKTEAEKKRKQRERAKRGSRVLLGLEIIDWDAWLEILKTEGLLHGTHSLGAVRLATERYVWEECRAYRREQAQERLSQVRAPITGLIDRETESRPDQLIKAKDLKQPRSDNANPAICQSIRAKQQAEADGFDQGDWHDEADEDDGMDSLVANALLEEGGYQVED